MRVSGQLRVGLMLEGRVKVWWQFGLGCMLSQKAEKKRREIRQVGRWMARRQARYEDASTEQA